MDVQKLRKQLYTNTKSSKTHLTSNLGCLPIMLTAEAYAKHVTEGFYLLVYPSVRPTFNARQET
jgi:hypothetical protein